MNNLNQQTKQLRKFEILSIKVLIVKIEIIRNILYFKIWSI